MADNRVELPDGAWADLRNPREITRKARRPIQAANAAIGRYKDQLRQLSGEKWDPSVADDTPEAREQWIMSEEEVALYDDLNTPLTLAMVEAWSWDEPITQEGLDNIPALAADELIVHVATGDYLTKMFVNTSEPNLEDDNSPT